MVHKSKLVWLVMSALVMTVITGCGGEEEINDFTDVREVRLTSLEVVSGGTLLYQEDPIDEFDSENIGPYRVELDDDRAETVTMRATIPDSDDYTLELVEVGKGNIEDSSSTNNDIVRDISSGSEVVIDLAEGTNIVFFRVSERGSAATSDYTVQINRVSTSNALAEVSVAGVISSQDSNNIEFSHEVTADRTSYDVTVNKERCAIDFIALAESRNATVSVDGVLKDRLESTHVPLDGGATRAVSVEVTPEDQGEPLVYTFNITRTALDDSELADEARLAALDIVGGRSTVAFRCDSDSTTQFISNDETSVELTATLETDRASMVFGRLSRDEDGNFITDDNDELVVDGETALTSGQAYQGDLLTDIAEGDTFYLIRVTSESGETTSNYVIRIIRSENNVRYVETVDQLHQALRNAVPGDDITIAKGDYLGVVGEASSDTGSGDPEAHFYSDASGTEDAPIFVTIEEPGVNLLGDDQSQHAVLKITGNYWRIAGVEVEGAQNGVVLDGANNVLLDSVSVENVGERGIVLTNGSSNNQIRGGRINRTGLMLEERTGITEVYGEGIVIGAGTGAANNNAVRSVLLGVNIANEAIDVKPNAAGTEIQYNVFDTDNTLSNPVENRSIILVDDAQANISFNQFDYRHVSSGTDNISQFIQFGAADGSTSEVYQNILNSDGESLVFMNVTGNGTVQVTDNFEEDSEVALAITGTVDTSFSNPVYQIQSNVDVETPLCFTRREETEITNDTGTFTLDFITLEACSTDAIQRWSFVHDEDGYLLIVSDDNPDFKINASSGFAVPREDNPDNNLDASFSLRWRMFVNNDLFSFSNRATPLLFMVENRDSEVTGLDHPAIFVNVPLTTVSGEFILNRQ